METDPLLHDSLTGLPGRGLFLDRLNHAIQRSYRSGGPVAVLFTDLDSFKSVNETYGWQVGDELLQAVAERLGRILRKTDTVTRLGGDVFVILCEDLLHRSHLTPIAARVDAGLQGAFALTTTEIEVSATVGIASSEGGDEFCDHIIEEAEAAMSWMKRHTNAGHSVFDLRSEPLNAALSFT
jgi:diguanylate cyclase (GGDEF)-like protein